MATAKALVVLHPPRIEVQTMTVSIFSSKIFHSDNFKNCYFLDWIERSAPKYSSFQGKEWVLKINLAGCRERDWRSRSHSEGLTSHRSYGRTAPRTSIGPIERKVSRQTRAKDQHCCIGHLTVVDTSLDKINQVSFFSGEDRKSPTLGAGSPCSSPNISVGPPQSPPTNPYTNLFNSSLYQQYLGQLLANGGGPQAPLNPMLLQVRKFYNSQCQSCSMGI